MIIEVLLLILLISIFVLPFVFKKIEEELEIFLFIAGVIAIIITSQWDVGLITDALIEPVIITLAVFIAGLVFKFIERPMSNKFSKIIDKIGQKCFFFIIIVTLGLISSIVTAIITALILVAIIDAIGLDKDVKIKFAVLSCFSIGLGATLTPIGEPLAVIIVAKLSGTPYHADFLFLFQHTWFYIIPAIVFLGILSMKLAIKDRVKPENNGQIKAETITTITKRAAKVYIFVIGLVFIGAGFKPLMEMIMANATPILIYWFNSVSAVLDNATLASAEIWPSMSLAQIISAILSLTMAGGMLIPGNIPNIVTAGKLKIKSKQWAKVGVPLGIVLMMVYFIVLLL